MNPSYYDSSHNISTRSQNAPCRIQKLPAGQSSSLKDLSSGDSNFFELIWVTKGVGNQWIDLQRMEIPNDRIICIRPGQAHRLESRYEIEGYVIRLSTSFITSVDREINSLPLMAMLELFSGSKGILLSTQLKSVLQELINQMEFVLLSTELVKTDLLKCYLEILITHLSHQWDGPVKTCSRTRHAELVESFLSLVEKNFKTERRVSEYASCLAVTPNYLNEVVKKLTGYSAGNVIRRRVGHEAKKALSSGMCMKAVAYSLGFSDPAHFSKFFKNTTGHNFSDLRKEKVMVSTHSASYRTE